MKFAFAILLAYLLGSVNPSIIQGRLRGIDIKKEGSGNAGATNCLRVMGKKAALISLSCDVLKGVLAVWLGRLLGGYSCAACCGVVCFAGGIWPLYFRFSGGKGVATCFGVMLAMNWKAALLAFLVALVTALITKMVSAGSLLGSVAMTLCTFIFEKPFVIGAAVMMIVIIVKHRGNIDRIRKGTEAKLVLKQ